MTEFEGKGFSFDVGKKTYVMGILNVTPDSFSDGGLWFDANRAAAHAADMQDNGADLIDIGAQSTRPGHIPVSPEEEMKRLEPVLKLIKDRITIPISIDTYYPEVADAALKMGVCIVNDVSGIVSPEMAGVVVKHNAGWVIMHTGGGDSLEVPEYERDDIASDVRSFFEESVKQAQKLGVQKSSICLDTGIGFGKTYKHNLILLRKMREVKLDGYALLTGVSRKRVVGQACGEPNAQNRLYGTIAAHTAAIAGGTDIIRVHDVKEAVQAARMADAIYR